ncbi:hypothetical protein Bca101_092623 [Brassica carinata]
MTSAEEFFSNCQIKPMKLSSHLQKPQVLAPLLDLEEEDEEKGKAEESNFNGPESFVPLPLVIVLLGLS